MVNICMCMLLCSHLVHMLNPRLPMVLKQHLVYTLNSTGQMYWVQGHSPILYKLHSFPMASMVHSLLLVYKLHSHLIRHHMATMVHSLHLVYKLHHSDHMASMVIRLYHPKTQLYRFYTRPSQQPLLQLMPHSQTKVYILHCLTPKLDKPSTNSHLPHITMFPGHRVN